MVPFYAIMGYKSIDVIIECERSELEKLWNWTVAREAIAKFCTFPPNSSKLRSDYLFSFQKRKNYLFPAFSRSEYLFPKSASPPPLRIKWLSPKGREGGRKEGKLCRMKKRKSKLRGLLIDSGTWNTALAFDMTNEIFLLSVSIFRFTPFARF